MATKAATKPTAEPKKRGRPTRYSEELAMDICTWIASGKTMTRYCKRPGTPNLRTVQLWLATKPDFYERHRLARLEQADILADEINDIVDDCEPGEVQKARLQMDARKWTAAVLRPSKYGERTTHKHEGGDTPIGVVNIHAGLPAEEAAMLYRELVGAE